MTSIDYVVNQIKGIKMDKFKAILPKLPLIDSNSREMQKRGRKR